MNPVRFIIVGGFLGAGKTTLLCRLAERYVELGKNVGVITNDQADNLVDTRLVKLRGLEAKEIPGGCFCCRLDELVETAEDFVKETQLHILLGEPVGSCADLAATVIQPLKRRYKDFFEIAPFSVAVDPQRLEELLMKEGRGKFKTALSYLTEIFILKKAKATFPASIAYLFNKQLEEADIILLNKIDLLSQGDRPPMMSFLKTRFPKTRVLEISARTGEGLDSWRKKLDEKLPSGAHLLEIDYDLYAQAEADLGWLNAKFILSRGDGFNSEAFVHELALNLRERFLAQRAEVAHLKMLLDSKQGSASVNLVSADAQPELHAHTQTAIKEATLLINARVHSSPELLRKGVTEAVDTVSRKLSINYSVEQLSSFRPSYPTPKYRYETTNRG